MSLLSCFQSPFLPRPSASCPFSATTRSTLTSSKCSIRHQRMCDNTSPLLPAPPAPPAQPLLPQSPPLPLPEVPRARKLSLTTTRELKYLKAIGVRRNQGRPIHFVRTQCFSLSIWSLSVHSRHNIPLIYEDDVTQKTTAWSADADADTDTGDFVTAPLVPDAIDEVDSDTSENNSENEYGHEEIREQEPEPEQKHEKMPESKLISTEKQKKPKKEEYNPSRYVPSWAYICYIQASKMSLGKRAVQRNRAKRRMRAVAAQILPQHAVRGMEYRFILHSDILIVDHSTLLNEVVTALKTVRCYCTSPTIEMFRREQYCKR